MRYRAIPAATQRSYARWCKREAYRFSAGHADRIYALAQSAVRSLPKSASTKVLITQAVDSLHAVYDILHKLRNEMLQFAEQLQEFGTVIRYRHVDERRWPDYGTKTHGRNRRCPPLYQ